jgi:predicted XRE-type DNA-binding protein
MSAERWLPVVGYEGSYEVSDTGRVRSLDRSWWQASRHGTLYEHFKKGRVLRPGPATAGHMTVVLGRGNTRLVHHLVLEAFVGPRPDGTEARHGDGNEKNNRLDNLQWDTRGNNSRDKKWHKGATTYKLSPPEIVAIKAMLDVNLFSQRKIGRLFNVTESNISCIKHRKIHIDV